MVKLIILMEIFWVVCKIKINGTLMIINKINNIVAQTNWMHNFFKKINQT